MDYGILGANPSETDPGVDFITASWDIIFYQPHLKCLAKKKNHIIFWKLSLIG